MSFSQQLANATAGPRRPSDYSARKPVAKITRPSSSFIRRPAKLFGVEDVLRQMHNGLWESSTWSPADGGMPEHSGIKAFMLAGKKGYGKTEIAREYVLRHENEFNAVAWLVAESKTSLDQGFAKFAIELKLTSHEQMDDTISRDILVNWLSNPMSIDSSGRRFTARWLLVIDNAQDSDAIMALWPYTGQGSILLLGREPLHEFQKPYGIACLDLPPLDEASAARLFRAVAEIGSSEDVVQDSLDIVRDWECIPIAIVHVATIFRKSSLSLEDFKQYQVTHRRKLGLGNAGDSPVLALIWVSEGRQLNELALLSVLCFFDHNEIPETVLRRHEAVIEIPNYPKGKEHQNCLDVLKRDRLIEHVSDKEGNSHFSMQKLVQESMRDMILRSADAIDSTFNAVARLVFSAWPMHLTKEVHFSQETDIVSRWERSNDLLPHGRRLRQIYTSMETLDQQACATEELAHLFVEISWFD